MFCLFFIFGNRSDYLILNPSAKEFVPSTKKLNANAPRFLGSMDDYSYFYYDMNTGFDVFGNSEIYQKVRLISWWIWGSGFCLIYWLLMNLGFWVLHDFCCSFSFLIRKISGSLVTLPNKIYHHILHSPFHLLSFTVFICICIGYFNIAFITLFNCISRVFTFYLTIYQALPFEILYCTIMDLMATHRSWQLKFYGPRVYFYIRHMIFSDEQMFQ